MRLFFIIYLSIIFVFPVFSQYSNIKFNHLTIEHGLSNSIVPDIYQDSRGYVWFATHYGLNRYDGYDFKVYYSLQNDSNSIASNRIYAISEAPNGDMLISTWANGLSILNVNTGKFTNYKNNPADKKSLPNNNVRGCLTDKYGNIWIATINSGLVLFNRKNNSFKVFNPDVPGSKQIYFISFANNGQIIVPYLDEGIFFFDIDTHKFTRIEDKTPGKTIHDSKTIKKARQTSDGLLWIATEGEGIYVYDFKTRTHTNYQNSSVNVNSLGSNVIRDITEDNNGIIWIATDGGGINRFNKTSKTFERLVNQPNNSFSVSTNQIYRIYIDKTGIFWIGTFSGGVNIYNPNNEKFKVFKPEPDNPNSLSYKSVLAIMQDKDENIWIGTDGGGVNIYNPKLYGDKFVRFKHGNVNNSLAASDVVKSIYQDKDGDIWFGTYQGGLDKYNPKTKKITNYIPDGTPTGLPTRLVWAMQEDSYGNFWISCLGAGVCIMDKKSEKFKLYRGGSAPGQLSNVNVMVIHEDSENRLWLGTEGDGLNLYDRKNDNFIVYKNNPNDKNSLSNNDVRAIYSDTEGNLWIGTIGGGLNLLLKDLKTFKHFTTANGLPSNVIYGILEDDNKNLWISTNKGICCFNYKSNTFRNFDKHDGLQSDEFTYTACCKTSDGRLLFGGIEGFNAFYPKDIKENTLIPPVYITDLLIFNKPVSVGDGFDVLTKPVTSSNEIQIPYRYSVFTLRFSALNYTHTVKNQYAFRLRPFEQKWNYVGNKRDATYTNLDPGTYTFEVKACNNDGIWNETGATIRIVIIPPWYKTIWADILKAVLVILAIYFLIVAIKSKFDREKYMMEEEKKRQQRQYEEEALKAEKQILALKNQQLVNDLQVLEQEKQLKHKEEELKEEQRRSEQEILKLQQEKLENEISYKSKELASLALNNSHKNEILISIKEELEKLISDKLPDLTNNSIRRIITSIQNDLDLDENWNQFEMHFDQVHENFLKRMKERFPHLKPAYLKLCAYIRMKLTSKQIAALMNSSVASVEKNRYRLREKLNLEEGLKLTDFIENF